MDEGTGVMGEGSGEGLCVMGEGSGVMGEGSGDG